MAPRKEDKATQAKDPKVLKPENLPKSKIKEDLTLLAAHLRR